MLAMWAMHSLRERQYTLMRRRAAALLSCSLTAAITSARGLSRTSSLDISTEGALSATASRVSASSFVLEPGARACQYQGELSVACTPVNCMPGIKHALLCIAGNPLFPNIVLQILFVQEDWLLMHSATRLKLNCTQAAGLQACALTQLQGSRQPTRKLALLQSYVRRNRCRSLGADLCGFQGLIKPLLPVHKAGDLCSQQPLRCVRLVARLLHAPLQGFYVLQGHEGEHAQEHDDLLIAHICQQVLVELEGRQLVCRPEMSYHLMLQMCCRDVSLVMLQYEDR